jgi:hypothetical protein
MEVTGNMAVRVGEVDEAEREIITGEVRETIREEDL